MKKLELKLLRQLKNKPPLYTRIQNIHVTHVVIRDQVKEGLEVNNRG